MFYHNIEPIYNNDSKVLMLGSFPSPMSRQQCTYYANPQNRMWKVLSTIFKEKLPIDKKDFLLRHHLAMWDVLKSCNIKGASDCSIKSEKPNDLRLVLDNSSVHVVMTTGNKAAQLYKKYNNINIKHISLPSTSSANASYSLNDLIQKYCCILKYVE